MNERQSLILGVAAVALAAASVPLLSAASLLHFVHGAVLAVLVPTVFGVVAVGAGVQLYRGGNARGGVTLAASSLLATATGVVVGLGSVV